MSTDAARPDEIYEVGPYPSPETSITAAVPKRTESLRTAMRAARLIHFSWDIDRDVVEWAGDDEVYGWVEGDAPRDYAAFARGVHPDDVTELRDRVWAAVEVDGHYEAEFRYRRPDGRVRWIAARGHVVVDPERSRRTLVGVNFDITHRVERQQSLRDRVGRFRRMFDGLPLYVAVCDLDGKLQFVNRAAVESAGAELARRIDEPFVEASVFAHDPAVRVAVAEALRRAASGERSDRTITYIDVSGHRRDCDITASPLRDGQDRLTGVIVSGVDVTDRLRAEREAEASAERLRLAARSAEFGTYDVDLEAGTIYWSPELRAIFGIADDAPVSIGPDDVPDYVHPDDRENVKQAIEASLDPAGDGDFEHEHRIVRPGGKTRWVLVRGGTTFDEGPDGRRAVRATGVVLDITTRKRLEEELRRIAADLSEANQRKDEFLATLAHELRNPMAPIRTGLEVIRMRPDDPAVVARTRETMERQTKQLIALVADLLDVSRITRGKLRLKTTRVLLPDVVASAVEASRPLIDEARHELTVEIPDEPIPLDADPHRLAQILSNLLSNAAKYTPEGGHVAVAVRPAADEVAVEVRDDGVGIPPAELDRIFEMFRQIERPLERAHGGLGIGLMLVKSLTEMHGGGVTVESEGEGRGSLFRVTLPRPRVPTPDDDAPAEPVRPARGRRVLVVDDNEAAVDMLRLVVEMLGLEARQARDGKEACEVAEEFRPEIVFMDIGMPVMNGYEAARAIRSEPWGKPIRLVALTGWGQEDDRKRTAEAGFDDHLTKPAEPADLRAILAAPHRESSASEADRD